MPLQLRRSGALELRADGRWALSPHLLEIAGRVQPLDGIRTSTNRIIQELRAETGQYPRCAGYPLGRPAGKVDGRAADEPPDSTEGS